MRMHGAPQRWTWRKIHIGINERPPEIRAAEVTTSNFDAAPMLPELLDQIPPDQETRGPGVASLLREVAEYTPDVVRRFATSTTTGIALGERILSATGISSEFVAGAWLAITPPQRSSGVGGPVTVRHCRCCTQEQAFTPTTKRRTLRCT
jgi:hypothetical protein